MKKILLLIFILLPTTMLAQTTEWGLIRKGNRAYHDRQYDKATQNYADAQKENANSVRADYNLGLVCIAKKDLEGAVGQFNKVLKSEQNKGVRSKAFFNRGYVFQTQASDSIKNKNEQGQQEKLRAAIEEYKNALRLNPNDSEARYNLALCQKQLKQSGQNGGQGKDKDKQDKDKKDKDKEKKDQKNSDKDQKQQDKKQDQDKNKQNGQNQQQPQSADPKQSLDRQTQQLLNLTRQAEQKTRRNVNESKQPSRRSQQRQSGPNW